MRIKMLSTRRGSPDGVRVLSYRDGETYEVPDELGQVFLREGWALRPRRARKDAGGAPENKAAAATTEGGKG